jgi:hypothetical protein
MKGPGYSPGPSNLVFRVDAFSNTERSALPSCRTAECSSGRAAARTRTRRRSASARRPTRERQDISWQASSCSYLLSCVCEAAGYGEKRGGSPAAPARSPAVAQVFLTVAGDLPLMPRAGGSRNAGQNSDRQSKRQGDFGDHGSLSCRSFSSRCER